MDITVDNVFPDGPSSNPTQPSKALIRSYFRQFETAVDAGLSNGGLIYDTKANMDADLAHDANASAWVIADSTVANNGIYRKSGASGSGSWTRIADLPYSFIRASNAGAGTANAIQATTKIPIPAGDGAAEIILNISANNTGAATVSFNGGSALTIKTASGADVQEDYLVAGAVVSGYVVGSTFQLTSEVGTAAAAAAAQAAADAAVAAASSVVSTQKSRAYAIASYHPVAAPDFIQTAGYASAGDWGAALYKKVVSEPAHEGKLSITLDDGSTVVWFELAELVVNPFMFGAAGDGVSDDTSALQSTLDFGGNIVLPERRSFYVTDALTGGAETNISGGGKIVAGPVDGFTSNDFASAWAVLIFTDVTDFSVTGVEFDISAWDELPSGVASLRCILVRRCEDWRITDCWATTTGGFVASVGNTDFEITGNTIQCVQPGSEANVFADGVIDCWVEFNLDSERVIIADNNIRGGGFARWGIMITGLEYLGVDMNIYNYVVADNVITGCYYDGIWAFGRDASLNGITITGNVIDTARKGIAISDAKNFLIDGNVIKNTTSNGIELFSEGIGDGAGCKDGIITNNKLSDVASSVSGTPAGIYLQNAATGHLVGGNVISGTSHYYGVFYSADSIGNRHAGNKITKGRGSKVLQIATGNLVDGLNYTPTLTNGANVASSFVRSAHFYAYDSRVTVFFDIAVTPTAGSSTSTVIGLSLPVSSDLTADTLYGSGAVHGAGTASVIDDATNDRATITFPAPGTGQQKIVGSFSYVIA